MHFFGKIIGSKSRSKKNKPKLMYLSIYGTTSIKRTIINQILHNKNCTWKRLFSIYKKNTYEKLELGDNFAKI